MDTFNALIPTTDPSTKSHLHGYWTAQTFSPHRALSIQFPPKALRRFLIPLRLPLHAPWTTLIYSFSFRRDLGLEREDEEESVSDYGTVLHTGEASRSAPLTSATGLRAVEEITEGGLTDSRTTSTVDRLSLGVPPGHGGLGSLPSHDRKGLEVTKPSENIPGRLRAAMVSDRLVSRLSIPWPLLVPAPPVAKVQAGSSENPLATLHPRPRNKLRKKTWPSIAITLAVGPASSFPPAQPLARALETLQCATSSDSVSPVAELPSARSFLSFASGFP